MGYHSRIRRSTKLPNGDRYIQNWSLDSYLEWGCVSAVLGFFVKLIFFPFTLPYFIAGFFTKDVKKKKRISTICGVTFCLFIFLLDRTL